MKELTFYVEEYLKSCEVEHGSDPVVARTLVEALIEKEELGRVVSTDGSLYLFDGAVWNRVQHNALVSMSLLFDGLWLPGEKPKRLSIGLSKAQNVAQTTLLLHENREEDFFASVPAGIATREGFWTVDEWGVEMLEHSPEHLCTWSYDFEIDPDATPQKWLRFLDSLWKDDADKQSKIFALQEWLGCCLIGKACDYARCLLMVGRGGNGKSVLMSAIEKALFPPELITSASPRRWGEPYTVAQFREPVRINFCAELPEYNALESSDMFKSIISGDRVSAREPYQPPFSFIPRAGHVFSANALPAIGSGDYSDGFFRRFLILGFNRSFTNDYALERRDQSEILQEIIEERSAIVYWALHGASRLLKRGNFTLPSSHQETIAQWHADSDPVKDFTEACCEAGESPLSALFEDFKDFCSGTGRRHGSSKTLAKRLRLLGYTGKRRAKGTAFNLQTKLRADWADYQSSGF